MGRNALSFDDRVKVHRNLQNATDKDDEYTEFVLLSFVMVYDS